MARRTKSTIVRKKLAYLALRGGMRATQAVSRSAAAAWSERLFLTPPRYPLPERERPFLATGRPERVRFGAGQLAVWSWDGAGAAGELPPVILVHGWAGRAGQFATIAPALAAAGRRVVAFDAPGHGDSSGTRCSLPELADAVCAVAGWTAGAAPVAVVAHSFGSPATVLAMRRGVAVERAAFLAPAAEPMSFFGEFARQMGLSRSTLEALMRRIEARFKMTADDFDVLGMAGEMRAPLLVVHDWADAAVPFSQGERLAAAWPDATLVTTAGLDHVRVLHHPEVVERITRFVTGNRVAPSRAAHTAPSAASTASR